MLCLLRLKAKGLLSDIQAEWEDWQHDLLLDTIRQQLTNPGSCAAPAKRRGRAELEAPSNTTAAPATQAAAAAAQEPRRVSTAHQAVQQGHTCMGRAAPCTFEGILCSDTSPSTCSHEHISRGVVLCAAFGRSSAAQQLSNQGAREYPVHWCAVLVYSCIVFYRMPALSVAACITPIMALTLAHCMPVLSPQVRTRRAPASFQDFHVETPASGSPDRADINLPAVAAADTQRRVLSMQQQQQQQLHAAADRAAWDQAPTRAGLNGYSGRQQQQQHLLPPPLPRLSNLGRQQQQHRLGASQPHSEVVSDEFLSKFQRTIQLVLSSGNAQGMEGAAALLADPSALKAFVNALSQHTDNPAAAMHRVAATLAGQQVQP